MRENLLVVKIGGGRGLRPEWVCQDVAALVGAGRRVVLVHGASARADELGLRLGRPPRTLRSPSGHLSRYTDARTLQIFVQAARAVNAELAAELGARGVAAEPLAGREHLLLHARRKAAVRAVVDGRVRIIRDDYSGRLQAVERSLLLEILGQGRTPVIPPLAWSPQDGLLNVDGDRVAAAVAAALGAEQLLLLTNVPGLLQRYPDPASLVRALPARDLGHALDWAQGRMKRKVLSAREALEGGVQRVGLADGRVPRPLLRALAGGGTWIG